MQSIGGGQITQTDQTASIEVHTGRHSTAPPHLEDCDDRRRVGLEEPLVAWILQQGLVRARLRGTTMRVVLDQPSGEGRAGRRGPLAGEDGEHGDGVGVDPGVPGRFRV